MRLFPTSTLSQLLCTMIGTHEQLPISEMPTTCNRESAASVSETVFLGSTPNRLCCCCGTNWLVDCPTVLGVRHAPMKKPSTSPQHFVPALERTHTVVHQPAFFVGANSRGESVTRAVPPSYEACVYVIPREVWGTPEIGACGTEGLLTNTVASTTTTGVCPLQIALAGGK
jgi:hypothetical protein